MVVMACELVDRDKTIPDPRRQCRNLKHRLEDIIVLGFCGVLAGCDDFVEIADWANQNVAFFRTFLELPHGIPSHDTFNRVFAMVKPAALQEVLLPWLLQRRGLPGEWVHLDGKAMRHTRRKSTGLGALHVVSAWAGHLSPSVCQGWLGLLTLVMVVRAVTCQATGAVTTEASYFISSLRPNARRVGRAIRGHWGIENGLHWVLDVVFREDARRLYERTSAENVAFLNRLAVSLLRGDPAKGSLQVKRKRAGWNIQYLAQLLGFPSI